MIYNREGIFATLLSKTILVSDTVFLQEGRCFAWVDGGDFSLGMGYTRWGELY